MRNWALSGGRRKGYGAPAHPMALSKRVAELRRERVPSRAGGRRGYGPWRLAALRALKAAFNLSFRTVAKLAPVVVGVRPHHTTVWPAWLRMRGLAEGLRVHAARLYGVGGRRPWLCASPARLRGRGPVRPTRPRGVLRRAGSAGDLPGTLSLNPTQRSIS